jgi:fructokinase
MKTFRPLPIATFGEALWDILPRGIFLGGAPLNVAYHLACNGVQAYPITAVGQDFLGAEILRRLAAWRIDTRFVAQLPRSPTGTVRATLDAAGVATYDIARDVAWDRIPVTAPLLKCTPPAALVFGSLALRENPNRLALEKLCRAWPSTLRVLDINLRPPFDQRDAIAFALKLAQLVKLNDEELARLTAAPTGSLAQLRSATGKFAATHGLTRVCVTAGARGAGLWWEGNWIWSPGRKVLVRDTVGAGDSFLGALLASLLLRDLPPAQALARACRLGEFIASRDGATPPYRFNAKGQPVDA